MKLLFILIILQGALYSQNIEIPANDGRVIERDNYTLSYNEKFEQANWVAYELTREEVLGSTARKDSFKADSSISTGSASLLDYKGSGYDRGHLAPAADMKMSSSSMSDSFYMSNMSPQDPGFNRGIWSKLESYVRTWAVENEAIYIVTGPVLTKNNYPRIGTNEVAVPEYYYKVILDYTGDQVKAIGFILPNEKSSRSLIEYAVTIDDVEGLTGIDFYPLLDDSIENTLESSLDVSLWSFKGYRASNKVDKAQEVKEVISETTYWINSSSDTRHNSSCRYYEKTKKGYLTNEETGTACKTCGG